MDESEGQNQSALNIPIYFRNLHKFILCLLLQTSKVHKHVMGLTEFQHTCAHVQSTHDDRWPETSVENLWAACLDFH